MEIYVQLSIRAVVGEKRILNVKPDDIIANQKSNMYDKTGIPSLKQILSFFIGLLSDSSSTLSDYKIRDPYTLSAS